VPQQLSAVRCAPLLSIAGRIVTGMANSPPAPDKLVREVRRATMTRHEVAEEFAVSLDTVDRMIRRGSLRTIKIGQLVRIPRDSVEELLRSGGVA
jgi:excisionase family DNA binding protein